jgi:membrane-associated phospholipid phosphatase
MRRAKAPEKLLERPVRAIWLGLALLGLVAVMAVLVPTEPLRIDERWSEAMRDIEAPLLKDLALFFDALGRGVGRVPLYVAVGLVLVLARRWLPLVCFAVTEFLTSVSAGLLKAAVGRPRPPDGLIHPLGSSFPSGHAAYASATCVALVLVFTAVGPRRRWWWALAAVGIVGMAWSRTYLQVHWLSDVVGGSLLGVGVALLVFGGAERVLIRASGRAADRAVAGSSRGC